MRITKQLRPSRSPAALAGRRALAARAPSHVTRDDVARLAGVSVATVSYVLNNGPRGVSEDKRRRVLAAIDALGYRPNAIAQSLRARRTRILGLVLPDTANPYFAALSHALEEAAGADGYQVVVSNAAESPEREATQIEALLRLQVDGLLWIPADLQRATRDAWPSGVPTVQVDRVLQPDGRPVYDGIVSDNTGGGRLAAEHLLQLGHRRIAFLAGPADHLHARDRLRGAQKALTAAGVDFATALVAHGHWDHESGAVYAARWCALPPDERPTAIHCGNDAMAIGALCAIARAGLRVPDDISVTGYDGVPQAAYTVPPLTTIAQPLEEIATAAVARLLARIETRTGSDQNEEADGPAPEYRVLPVRLVVRQSTGTARKNEERRTKNCGP